MHIKFIFIYVLNNQVNCSVKSNDLVDSLKTFMKNALTQVIDKNNKSWRLNHCVVITRKRLPLTVDVGLMPHLK